MEFFRNVNINWMGCTKYFVSLSLLLLAIGWLSVLRHHGLDYGIDFRGGTLIDVRFPSTPPIDKIRKGLADAGLANSTIKSIGSQLDPNSLNDIEIGLEQKGESDLDADRQAVVNVLNNILGTGNAGAAPYTIRSVDTVGPTVGAQLRHQAIWATLYALGGMLLYIAFRFEWVYGAAAVIAVFHDVLITLGFFSLFHYEISLTVIAALLTLVGYSMNDTIVIFDRVRENLRLMRRQPFPEIVNRSINQTLSRTILTSGLTLLTVLVLYLMGGAVLRAFSFAMVVGVVVGTYSSFGIAAPIVIAWNKYHGGQGAAIRAGSATGPRVPAVARR
ncbi:MAG: protein translocase subunit SecF [Candidatus Acidiferrales bacterium]